MANSIWVFEGLGQIMAAAGAGALISSFLIASRKKAYNDNGIPMIARISLILGLLFVTILGYVDNWYLAICCLYKRSMRYKCCYRYAINRANATNRYLQGQSRKSLACNRYCGSGLGSILSEYFPMYLELLRHLFLSGLSGYWQ